MSKSFECTKHIVWGEDGGKGEEKVVVTMDKHGKKGMETLYFFGKGFGIKGREGFLSDVSCYEEQHLSEKDILFGTAVFC